MSEYFGYIHEASYEDIEDVNVVYNEMDASLTEFDSYVQEGVGIKILIGVGIAAALAGIIALIVKLFSNKSGSSAGKKAAKTKSAIKIAQKNGVTTIELPLPQGINVTQEDLDKATELVGRYTEYSEKYTEKIKNEVEKIKTSPNKLEDLKATAEEISRELLQDFPELKQFAGSEKVKNAIDTAKEKVTGTKLSADTLRGAAKKYAHGSAQRVTADQCIDFCDKAMDTCKRLLRDGKLMDKNKGILGRLLKGTGLDSKIEDKIFEKISAGITTYIKNCYEDIDGTCDVMIDYFIENLEKVAPEVAKTLKTGGNAIEFAGAGKKDYDALQAKFGSAETINVG